MGIGQYFQLGLEHILDLNGYDHILFVITMCAIYRPADWKKILLLVTAFTIGHSLTLALCAFDVLKINSALIEFLIPLTIFLTALWNIISKEGKEKAGLFSWNYFLVLVFGWIHGMGFSNYFRMLVGKSGNVLEPLFGFNVGVEVGQILVVILFMFVAFLVLNLLKVKFRYWKIGVSVISMVISFYLMLNSDLIAQ